MRSYRDSRGQQPAFQVRYRFLRPDEGGRSQAPRQHIRWDFLYAGDDVQGDGLSMIWPEFVAPDGNVLPEGEVPAAGVADMFLVNSDRAAYHRRRLAVGTKGYFMEGPKKVAECEVVALGSLVNEDAV